MAMKDKIKNVQGDELREDLVLIRTRAQDLKSVKKLNCWASNIGDISVVRRMPNLEVCSLSINKITTLRDFAHCKKLQELYVRTNNIQNLEDIHYLKELSSLRSLWLAENPCASRNNYRMTILKTLPNLHKLDNVVVTEDEVCRAKEEGDDLPVPEDVSAISFTIDSFSRPEESHDVNNSCRESESSGKWALPRQKRQQRKREDLERERRSYEEEIGGAARSSDCGSSWRMSYSGSSSIGSDGWCKAKLGGSNTSICSDDIGQENVPHKDKNVEDVEEKSEAESADACDGYAKDEEDNTFHNESEVYYVGHEDGYGKDEEDNTVDNKSEVQSVVASNDQEMHKETKYKWAVSVRKPVISLSESEEPEHTEFEDPENVGNMTMKEYNDEDRNANKSCDVDQDEDRHSNKLSSKYYCEVKNVLPEKVQTLDVYHLNKVDDEKGDVYEEASDSVEATDFDNSLCTQSINIETTSDFSSGFFTNINNNNEDNVVDDCVVSNVDADLDKQDLFKELDDSKIIPKNQPENSLLDKIKLEDLMHSLDSTDEGKVSEQKQKLESMDLAALSLATATSKNYTEDFTMTAVDEVKPSQKPELSAKGNNKEPVNWEDYNLMRVQLGVKPVDKPASTARSLDTELQNSNILQAVLCLVKELDKDSLGIVASVVKGRLDNLTEHKSLGNTSGNLKCAALPGDS